MNLPGAEEWGRGGQEVKGTDVYHAGSGRVREEWLSRCKEERALTTGLMGEVADLSNLAVALRQVVSNGGAPGIDGMTVKELETWFQPHYQSLQSQLINHTYQISKIRGIKIPKPSGGERQLGIPMLLSYYFFSVCCRDVQVKTNI